MFGDTTNPAVVASFAQGSKTVSVGALIAELGERDRVVVLGTLLAPLETVGPKPCLVYCDLRIRTRRPSSANAGLMGACLRRPVSPPSAGPGQMLCAPDAPRLGRVRTVDA